MWYWHEQVKGIDVGYTELWPMWSKDKELKKRWRRPSILLTRKSIHDLAKLSKEQIIEFLYLSVRESETMARHDADQYGHDSFSPPRRNVSGFVYFMHAPEKEKIKIGCSGNPEKRLKTIQREIGTPLVLLKKIATSAMYELEHELHNLFRCRAAHGEWFSIKPNHLRIVDRYLRKSEAA